MPKAIREFPNLHEFMRVTNTTQAEIARAIGVAQPTVARYVLNGIRRKGGRDMRLSVALRLAEFARIPVESLLPPAVLKRQPRRKRAA